MISTGILVFSSDDKQCVNQSAEISNCDNLEKNDNRFYLNKLIYAFGYNPKSNKRLTCNNPKQNFSFVESNVSVEK